MLKQGKHKKKFIALPAVFMIAIVVAVFAISPNAKAAQYSADVNVDRENGVCNYTLAGIDTAQTSGMTTKITYKDESENTVTVLEQPVTFTAENCQNGQYSGSFSLSDLSTYAYREYTVSFLMSDGTPVEAAAKCDFSIHRDKFTLDVAGYKSKTNRTISLVNKENDIIIPGKDSQIQLSILKKNGKDEKKVGTATVIPTATKSWDVDLTKYCNTYGTYYARFTVINSKLSGGSELLAQKEFNLALTYGKIGSKSTSKTEKNQTFRVFVEKVNSALVVKNVTFNIYNSAGKLVCTEKGVHNGTSTYYYSDIPLKTINYKFGNYKIEVSVTDNAGIVRILKKTGTASVRVKTGTLTVTKLANGTAKFRLKNAYIPGNIKSVRFKVYSIKNGKRTLIKKLIGVYSNKTYIANYQYMVSGRTQVVACGYTQWNKEIKFKTKEFSVKSSEVGKNGWRYEKYAGKVYKFYYKNGEKLTDLTNVLKLKKGNKKLKIVVNRAACCVTIDRKSVV